MALSDEERQRLEQLEALLAQDDPTLAHTLRGESRPQGARVDGRAAALGGVGFIAGIGLLVAGMQWHWTICIVGFLVMLASAAYLLSSRRPRDLAAELRAPVGGSARAGTRSSTRRPAAAAQRSAFMDRLEDRWRRRQQGGR